VTDRWIRLKLVPSGLQPRTNPDVRMNKACLGNVFNPLEAAYFWGGGKMFGPRRGSYSPLIYLMEGVKVFQNLALGGRDF